MLIELAAGAQNCDVFIFIFFFKVHRFLKKFKTLYIILESESTNTVCLGAVSNGLFFFLSRFRMHQIYSSSPWRSSERSK